MRSGDLVIWLPSSQTLRSVVLRREAASSLSLSRASLLPETFLEFPLVTVTRTWRSLFHPEFLWGRFSVAGDTRGARLALTVLDLRADLLAAVSGSSKCPPGRLGFSFLSPSLMRVRDGLRLPVAALNCSSEFREVFGVLIRVTTSVLHETRDFLRKGLFQRKLESGGGAEGEQLKQTPCCVRVELPGLCLRTPRS